MLFNSSLLQPITSRKKEPALVFLINPLLDIFHDVI